MKNTRLMYISSIVTMLVLFSTTIAQDLSTVTRPRRVRDVNQQASPAPVESELAMNTRAEPAPNLTTMVTGIRLPKKPAPETRATTPAADQLAKPTVNPVFIGADEITGTGVVDASVTITKGGNPAHADASADARKVKSDGSFKVKLKEPAKKTDKYMVKLEKAGNVASEGVEASVDKLPKPTVNAIKADAESISGKANPKATVRFFRNSDSTQKEVTAGDTGLFIAAISPPAAKGDVFRVQQVNKDDSSDFEVVTVGAKAPDLETPSLNQVNVGDDSISGKTEGGVDVKYFRRSHTEPERTAKADASGSFIIRGISPPIGKDDKAFITVTRDDQTISVDIIPVGRMDLTHANLIGIAPFGVVLSNQADRFSQSDPFGGFVIGYMGKARNRYLCRYVTTSKVNGKVETAPDGERFEDCRNWDEVKKQPGFFDYCLTEDGKLNPDKKKECVEKFTYKPHWQFRIQGVFQTDGRAAAAPEAATDTNPAPPEEPQTFIASRKSFDVDIHMWKEMRAPFTNVLTWGPYAGIGGTFALSKNELGGEAVNVDTGGGGNSTPLDTNQVTSSNSGKIYYEGGLALNLYSHDEADANLYVQAFMAFGHYEAFADLRPEANTKLRGVGKLRVFPFGLNRDFFEHGVVTPMFGIELNAGKGPDHVKFFIGSVFNISKFIEKIKGSTTGNN